MTGVELVEIPAPMDAAWYNGELYVGEAEIMELLISQGGLEEFNRFALTVTELAKALDEEDLPLRDPELMALDAISSAQWFREQGFPEFFAAHYGVTSRGLFGAPLGEVSALCAISEISFDFEGFEPVEDLLDLGPDDPGSGAYSFTRGIVQLTDALGGNLGDSLRTSSTVRNVARVEDGGFLVTFEDASGSMHTIAAQAVVLAVPAPVALEIGGSALSREQVELMQRIPFAPFATAAVFSEEPIWEQSFDLSLPPSMLVTDVYDGTWMAKAADPSVADSGVHIACLYAAPDSYQDLALLHMDEDDLMAAMLADMERVLPGSTATVTGTEMHVFRYAYPVMTPGAYTRLARLNELNRDGLYLAGDGMRYPTFEDAAESGLAAAEALMRDMDQGE